MGSTTNPVQAVDLRHGLQKADQPTLDSVDIRHRAPESDGPGTRAVEGIHVMQAGPGKRGRARRRDRRPWPHSAGAPAPEPEPGPQATPARAPRPDQIPGLLQVVLQLAAAGRVAQLAQGFGLDLADPLAGDVEFLAHFLKGAGPAVLETEAELEDASLAAGE